MRADRLLSILLLLQVHQRITAKELASRLEVSERTIHRDMEALSSSGIPVVADRGTGGGWRLLEEYRTRLNGLNENEVEVLFMGLPERVLRDLGLQKASEGAQLKLFTALPTMYKQRAEYARQRLYIDSASWRNTEEATPALARIQEAVWQDRKLSFSYRRADGTYVERVADPLGLVVKGSVWYLVVAIDDSVRTYRISRIKEAQVLDEASQRPPDFDLASYWKQSLVDFKAALPRYYVTVYADEYALARLNQSPYVHRIEQMERLDGEGRVKLVIRFDVEMEAHDFLIGFGSHIEIIEPDTLREHILQTARNLLSFYERKTSVSVPLDDEQVDQGQR